MMDLNAAAKMRHFVSGLRGFQRLLLCGLLLALSGCELLYTPMVLLSCSTQPALDIRPDTLPVAEQFRPYNVALRVAEPVTPVSSVYLRSGQLPDGIRLTVTDSEAGSLLQPDILLTGEPQAVGEFEFTLRVQAYGSQCSGPSGQQTYRLTVTEQG